MHIFYVFGGLVKCSKKCQISKLSYFYREKRKFLMFSFENMHRFSINYSQSKSEHKKKYFYKSSSNLKIKLDTFSNILQNPQKQKIYA